MSEIFDGNLNELSEFFDSIEIEFIQDTIRKYKFTKIAQQWPISAKEKRKIAKFHEFLKEIISDFECTYGDKYDHLIQDLNISEN